MKNVKLLFLLIFLLANLKGNASHIFGGDLSYKHISGYTYEINLTLYGDCSGNSFPNLFSSQPVIAIYNGNSAYSSITLSPSGIPGLEVTPVCPSEILNTKCNGGTFPGVAQFIFIGNVTLSGPSNDWKFLFNGALGANSGTGRSGAITNIVQAQNTSLMKLEATLNNSTGANNSSIYTTIPTPFFCINIPQQYNQGAIDNDGDILSYELVSGLDGNGGFVTYQTPYTYLAPLATSPGSFSFSNSTGQLTFQPNAIQNSLVVSKVIETRNGVVVGTSMREMTFVVLNNCNNQSPIGQIASTSLGSITNYNTINICNAGGILQFTINASDPDNDIVNAIVSGLPAGATYTIIGNNSSQVSVNVSWNIPANLPLGNTSFYITFQDNGCPLSSKQTIAYTIVYDQPIMASTTVDDISCMANNDGQIVVNGSSTNGAVTYSINGSSFQSSNVFTGLTQGIYTIQVKDLMNCSLEVEVEVNASPKPEIIDLNAKNITCFGKQNGTITLSAIPTSIYNYLLLPNAITNNTGIFTGLAANVYTLVASDNKGCADTADATILEPLPLAFGSIEISNLTCNKNNGKIIAKSNSINNGTYILSPGLKTNDEGYFDNLSTGLYTITVQTGEDCQLDSVVYVDKDPQTFFIATTQQNLTCNGWGNEGEATVSTIGGIPPYVFNWNTSPTQTTAKASNLFYGWYTVSVTDATGCEQKDTIYIEPGTCCENIFFPNAFSPNGDGINDEWRMVTTIGLEIKEFSVFNRFGQKIWSTQNQYYTWDGTYQNEIVELGTYYYVLKYKCLTDGKTYIKKGDVNIIK